MSGLARLFTHESGFIARARHPAATRAQGNAAREASVPHQTPRVGNQLTQWLLRNVQTRLSVGASDDAFEQEAERTAATVTGMGNAQHTPASQSVAAVSPIVQRRTKRSIDDDDTGHHRLQKRGTGAAGPLADGVSSAIEGELGMGTPFPRNTQTFFESRFGYDFGAVRLHTDHVAADTSALLSAQAFTVGSHIFFGSGQFQPDTASGRHLIAHELTHTIQQTGGGRAAVSAQAAPVPVSKAPRAAQRSWVDDQIAKIGGALRDFARSVPGYELMTVVLGRDPLTDTPVERDAPHVIHAVLGLFPGGDEIYQSMEENKQLEQALAWFHAEVDKLDLTWEGVKQIVRDALDSLHISDALDPAGAWHKLVGYFAPPLKRIRDFAGAVFGKIFDWIKKLALNRLREWGTQQAGYKLFTFVLGKDPFTDEPVLRTPAAFVQAVLDLVPGGAQIYDNLQKSHTIEKTVAWLNGEIVKLDLSWEKIKALFAKAWDLFTPVQLLHPLDLLAKLGDIFLPPIGRVITFAIDVGKKVLEFIFEGAMMLGGPLAQQVLRIFQKASTAFHKIVADPVAFLGHLLDAIKLGVRQFMNNALEHLKTGLFEWLTDGLTGAGIKLPAKWDLKGVVGFVLDLLGITYAALRQRLVKLMGEKRVATIEKVFHFLYVIVTQGIGAAWQEILQSVGNFWDMVIGGIKNWVVTKLVKAAVMKLVTLFNPVGAIIQSIITIYDTVVFFVEKIKQVLTLIEAITDSILNIANGAIAAAANYVERSMAKAIPPMLSFLSELIGLGDISEAIVNVITPVRQKVSDALDKLTDWIKEQVERLLGKEDEKDGSGGDTIDKELDMEGEGHTLTVVTNDGKVEVYMASERGERLAALIKKANAEIDADTSHSDEKKTNMKNELVGIALICNETDIYQRSINMKSIEYKAYARSQLDLASTRLTAFGKKYKLKSLQLEPVPAIRYLPLSIRKGKIRDKLYYALIPGGWKSKRAEVMADQQPALSKKLDPIRKEYLGRKDDNGAREALDKVSTEFASAEKLIHPEMTPREILEPPDYAYRPKGPKGPLFAIDHSPSLAEHWSTTGRKSDDTERQAAAEGKPGTPLTMVTSWYNSHKGSADDDGDRYEYDLSVEPPFKSQFAEDLDGKPNTANPAKLYGEWFLREENGPPIGN